MKKLSGFIILLAAIGGSAYYYFVYDKVEEKPQVLTQTISRGDIVEAVVATGTLDPVRRVDVGSQVSGMVQELFADFNDIVTEGQVLAQIDPSLLQMQVEIQTANIERQKGDIENQKVQLEDTKNQLRRTEELFAQGLTNELQMEAAQLAVKNRDANILSAQKSLISAERNLDQAKLNVDYTTIKSPINGVVVQRHVDRGQTVQSSMNSPQFFTLATDLRSLKLTAGVDEADIGKVRPNMDVIFTVDAYGAQQFYGKVNSVRLNASTQNNVVTYPVWIDVPNPDLKLRPSMTASARIIVRTATDVLRLPNQASRFRPNTDIYLALGLEPPAPGQGNAGRGGRANGDPQTPPAAGASGGRTGGQSAAGQPAAGQAASGQRAGAPAAAAGGRSGRGGDAGAALDPNAMAALAERFSGGTGGRTGGSNRTGGRGGRGGGRGANAAPANQGPLTELRGTKIDDNFAELQSTITNSQVFVWNEEAKELKQISVRLGITDGTFTEVVAGDVDAGLAVVTGVILPVSATRTNPSQQNSIFNQQQGGGRGGFGGGGGGRGGGGRN